MLDFGTIDINITETKFERVIALRVNAPDSRVYDTVEAVGGTLVEAVENLLEELYDATRD